MSVLAPAGPPRRHQIWKSVLDRALAALLLLPGIPVIAVIALVVKLTSRGPAFYRQARVGKLGRPYILYKIRTMRVDSEKDGPCWSRPGDPRVTWVGAFLRRSHLDELPQLWNVLRGEMSLVGPRPERPEFVPGLSSAIPRYADRLSVLPGVTGLAQVQLPADTDLESVRRKLSFDLYYIERGGLWLDLRLLLATALKVAGVGPSGLAWVFALPRQPEVARQYEGHAGVAAALLPALAPAGAHGSPAIYSAPAHAP